MSLPIVVLSPPGMASASIASRSAGRRTSAAGGAEAGEHGAMFAKVALQREHADARRRLCPALGRLELGRQDGVAALHSRGGDAARGTELGQPRNWIFWSTVILAASMPSMASPRPTDTSARTVGSL